MKLIGYWLLDLFNGWVVLPLLKFACRSYDWLTNLHSRIDRITAPPPF